MGWTSQHATIYTGSGVNRKAECDKLFEPDRLIKSAMVGSVHYAAIKGTYDDPEAVWCAVTLTKVNNSDYWNFSWKDLDETCGVEAKCPMSIINLLTPTDNKRANEWREECKKYHAEKKKYNLSALPVGTVLKLEDGTLVKKMAPNHQFKRNWYWKCGTNNYIPATRIKKFEVIVKA